MAVTKSLYADWKNHQVTQELMSELAGDMEGHIATMINRGKPDQDNDQWIRAFVKVATSVIEYQPEIIQESELVGVQDVED